MALTPLEYRLLKSWAKNPQVVLTRQILLEKLWDIDENFVDEHALTAAVSGVRNKIEAGGQTRTRGSRRFITGQYSCAFTEV